MTKLCLVPSALIAILSLSMARSSFSHLTSGSGVPARWRSNRLYHKFHSIPGRFERFQLFSFDIIEEVSWFVEIRLKFVWICAIDHWSWRSLQSIEEWIQVHFVFNTANKNADIHTKAGQHPNKIASYVFFARLFMFYRVVLGFHWILPVTSTSKVTRDPALTVWAWRRRPKTGGNWVRRTTRSAVLLAVPAAFRAVHVYRPASDSTACRHGKGFPSKSITRPLYPSIFLLLCHCKNQPCDKRIRGLRWTDWLPEKGEIFNNQFTIN